MFKCLYEGCGDKARSRGLCAAHYNRAALLVRNGQITWEKLEKAGKTAPKVMGKVSAWFLKGAA